MKEIDETPKYVGIPTGPYQFVKEFGIDVPTFKSIPDKPCLKWHVPLEFRGIFRAKDLANFDPEKSYRTDDFGWVLCYGKTKKGLRCKRRAVNHWPRCNAHGGAIHPDDRLLNFATAEEAEDAGELTRYKQFLAGQLTVDELSDEELAEGGFRGKNGAIYRPKNIPRELFSKFTQAVYDRANRQLRSNTVEAAKIMAQIMMNPANEPAIRLKAAESILDRNLGKAPQVVNITHKAPWEEIFEGISGGSRQESRERRNYIEAEIVDEERLAIDGPNEKSDSRDIDAESPSDATGFENTELRTTDGFAHSEIGVGDLDLHLISPPNPVEHHPAVLAQELEEPSLPSDLARLRRAEPTVDMGDDEHVGWDA